MKEFLHGVIYLILKRDSNPQAPTRAEYQAFQEMREIFGKRALLSTGGMMQYSLRNIVPGMLAAARRCVSERLIPKLKLYLAVLREEKERQGYMKLSRKQSEAFWQSSVPYWLLFSGGESLSSDQRQARFERNGAGSGAVDSGWESRQRKGGKEKLLALALEDAGNYHLGLPVLSAISKNLKSFAQRKEDIYNQRQTKKSEERW